MITFNLKFIPKDAEVFICLDTGETVKKYKMERENDRFVYRGNEKYLNYYFEVNNKKYFTHKIEFIILSTMSSGKSTFINSLLGTELMPSENQACTEKIYKIEKIFGAQEEYLGIRKNGKVKRYYLNEEELKILNKDEEVKKIDIFTSFFNINHNITIYDTPGINSFQNQNHKEATYSFLEENKIKNIIYLIDVTKIGVNDEKYFLNDILELKNKKDFEIVFVLNKIDQLEEKENLQEILKKVKEYLTKNGFKENRIYPISAYYAKLFRKALKKGLETRREKSDFQFYYNLNSSEEKESDEIIEIGNKGYSLNKIKKIIESTGIEELEKEIQNINNYNITFSLKTV